MIVVIIKQHTETPSTILNLLFQNENLQLREYNERLQKANNKFPQQWIQN